MIGEIKMSQEVKENIEATLIFIGMIALSIFMIWLWTYDYVKYK